MDLDQSLRDVMTGVLLELSPEQRRWAIAGLTPLTRRTAMLVAATNALLEIKAAEELFVAGLGAQARAKFEHASALTSLTAELTSDTDTDTD